MRLITLSHRQSQAYDRTDRYVLIWGNNCSTPSGPRQKGQGVRIACWERGRLPVHKDSLLNFNERFHNLAPPESY
jgi:hypothetical protein